MRRALTVALEAQPSPPPSTPAMSQGIPQKFEFLSSLGNGYTLLGFLSCHCSSEILILLYTSFSMAPGQALLHSLPMPALALHVLGTLFPEPASSLIPWKPV